MDKILHYPLEGIYHNSDSLGSLRSCRILSINSMAIMVIIVFLMVMYGSCHGGGDDDKWGDEDKMTL